MSELATTRWSQGFYQEAEQLFIDAIAIIRKRVEEGGAPILLHAHLNNLGCRYRAMGYYAKAVQAHRESLDTMKDRPAEDPEKLSGLLNLAAAMGSSGMHDEAEAINQQVLATYSKILDEAHPSWMSAKVNLANSVMDRARSERDLDLLNEAKTMFEEVIQIGEDQGTNDSYAVVNAKVNLGEILSYMGQYEKAESLLKTVIEPLEHQGNPNVDRYQVCLAQLYRSWAEATGDGQYQHRAKVICEQLISMVDSPEAISFERTAIISAKQILGLVYSDEEKHGEVIKIAHEILRYVDDKYPEHSPKRTADRLRLVWLQKLGWSYHQLHDYSEAAKWYRLAAEGMQGHALIEADLRPGTHANLGYVLWRMGELEEARKTLHECLPQMHEELPFGHPFTVNVLRWLTGIHHQLGKSTMPANSWRSASPKAGNMAAHQR